MSPVLSNGKVEFFRRTRLKTLKNLSLPANVTGVTDDESGGEQNQDCIYNKEVGWTDGATESGRNEKKRETVRRRLNCRTVEKSEQMFDIYGIDWNNPPNNR